MMPRARIMLLQPSQLTPRIIGGSQPDSSLTLQSTSGVGTTDSIIFKGGNNGATTFGTLIAGQLVIPGGTVTLPAYSFGVDSGMGMYTASGSVRFATAGAQALSVASDWGTSIPATLNYGWDGHTTYISQASEVIKFTTDSVVRVTISAVGVVTATNEIRVGGDAGGAVGSTTMTNAVNTTLTNAYVVKGGQAATTPNTGWAKLYVGTTTVWIPYWANATP